jgi:hypothetical protein
MPVLIQPTTSAVVAGTNSARFAVRSFPRTISAVGLAGAEVVDLYILSNGTFVNTGVSNQLTVSNPVKSVSSEGDFQLVKGVTAGAVSASVSG